MIILKSNHYFLHMYVIIQKTKEIMTPQGAPNNISSGKLGKLTHSQAPWYTQMWV